MRSINPINEEPIRDYPEHTTEQVRSLLRQADEQFRRWRGVSMAERGRLMKCAAAVLRERSAEWSDLMTREMGKPITEAEAEVEKCAACCDFFAEHAAEYLRPETIASDATRSYVRH